MNWVPALCSLIREPHPCIQPLRNVWAQWSAFQPKPGDHRQLTNQGLSSAKQPRNHTSNPATCSKEKDFPVSFYYSSTVFPISCCNKFLWTQQFEMAQIWQLFRILLWVSAWHGVSWTVLLAGSSRGRHISLPFGSFRGHLHSIICVAFLHLQHTSSVTAVCVCVCVCVCSVDQSYLTLWHPVDCRPPGSTVHEISQARMLGWVAIFSSRGSSQPRDWTCSSCIAGRLTTSATLQSYLSLTTSRTDSQHLREDHEDISPSGESRIIFPF